MKANLTSKRLTYFVLFFIVFCMLSCSEKEEQVVSEISLSQPEIEINKLGFGKNGDEAGVEVTSNVYWEITKDENVDWIEVSPMGGTGTTKVVITALKNEGEPRSAELTLETLDGTKKTIQVNQSGGDEVIRFFSSDFGLEPVVEKAPVNRLILTVNLLQLDMKRLRVLIMYFLIQRIVNLVSGLWGQNPIPALFCLLVFWGKRMV